MNLPRHAFGALFAVFMFLAMLVFLTLGFGVPARAAEAPLVAADPALEARVQKLTAELRCLVCQNQTIADSHAELAVDLRNQVRDMLKRGDSDQQVLDYMTARYGDFVLYRPPVKGTTMLLWFGPVVLLVAGLAILVLVLRKRLRMSADQFEPDEEDATVVGEAAVMPASTGTAASTSAGTPAKTSTPTTAAQGTAP